MLIVSCYQRQRMGHRRCSNQRICHVNTVRQSVLFNQSASQVADGLGDGQYVRLRIVFARLERFLHRLQLSLVSAALRQLHVRHGRNHPIRRVLHNGHRTGVATCEPNQYIRVNQHAAGHRSRFYSAGHLEPRCPQRPYIGRRVSHIFPLRPHTHNAAQTLGFVGCVGGGLLV